MKLINNPAGHYRFLTGIAPYSAGVVAMPGYEIRHVLLRQLPPWRKGFEQVEAFLHRQERPIASLCAMELRVPAPLSFEGFAEFNGLYQEKLTTLGLLLDGRNPIARTNIAPGIAPPQEPSLYAFSYTIPFTRTTVEVRESHSQSDELKNESPTFVVAGAGDLRDQAQLHPEAIVRPGETSAHALLEKATVVWQVMKERLFGLGCQWSHCTHVNAYTVLPIHAAFNQMRADQGKDAFKHGMVWHYSYPPIQGLSFEMDLRGIRQEVIL